MPGDLVTILGVGDPHIRPEDLKEGEALIQQVEALAKEHAPDLILFFGDLHHYHDVVRLAVLDFWRQSLERLGQSWPVAVIRGNHDGPHDSDPRVNALWPHKHCVQVIDLGAAILGFKWGQCGRFAAVPYCATNELFVQECRRVRAADVVFCHQTFDGARFENGFYAPEGIKLEDVPQKLVISGHVHAPQEFGKVWYVGSPRWLYAGDVNQDRFLWTMKFDQQGNLVSRQPHPTDKACRRMVQVDDRESAPADPAKIDPAWRTIVDVYGSEAWVQQRKAAWASLARVRTHPERARAPAVKESEGVPQSFRRYLGSYRAPNGTPTEALEKMAADRLPGFF